MRYWLTLFSWKTWQDFLSADADITGFRANRWNSVRKVAPGDRLLCYLTGVSRFFAILDVTGAPYQSDLLIWGETIYPCRIPVKVALWLEPENAVPIFELSEALSYFQKMKTPNSWTGHFRGSPIEEKKQDAIVIMEALEESYANPIYRPYDRRKLSRRIPVFETTEGGLVVIPENGSEVDEPNLMASENNPITHEEIQWNLLNLGRELGLDVWVARDNCNSTYNGIHFGSLMRKKELPVQFDQATNRIIELIDVLWLNGNTIEAAFEVEHTTTVYSGLLRMADLVAMQPNINIKLYIVAPDERRNKVLTEINRPTFSRALRPPLTQMCRYIPYSVLLERLSQARQAGLISYLKPQFIDEIAESVEVDEN